MVVTLSDAQCAVANDCLVAAKDMMPPLQGGLVYGPEQLSQNI
jgi:hypothetical protein